MKYTDFTYYTDLLKDARDEIDHFTFFIENIEDEADKLEIDPYTFMCLFTEGELFVLLDDGNIEMNDTEFTINHDSKGYFIRLNSCSVDKVYLKDYMKTWALSEEELE